MSAPSMTPMMQQYLSIKEKYKDAILFYRMGDFYEMFFEDALTASKVLEITLTSRNKNDAAPVPMCGFPYRAAPVYIGKLITGGFKVAVCDQMEDPALAKGLVKREVVRVITPGMVVEDAFLDERSNNFILSAFQDQEQYALACLDISTGTFRVTESGNHQAILEEVLRISPREVVLPATASPFYESLRTLLGETAVSPMEDREFAFARSRQRLTEHFGTFSLEAYGCEHLKTAVGAAGALMAYVEETQKQKLSHIATLETYQLDGFLWLDDLSCRNLELLKNLRTGGRPGTLLSVLDKTLTPMGGRLIRHWLRYPLLSMEEIEARLDAVEEGVKRHTERAALRESLKSVYDLERLGSKIGMGQCSARDLLALKQSLRQLPDMAEELSRFTAVLFAGIGAETLASLLSLADLIDDAIREDAPPTLAEGGMIKPGFNPELDKLIRISRDGKGWFATLEATEREQTGIGSLKVRYNKVFGYYIEISHAHAKSVPAHYVRKQTLVNAERYITDELKQFENEVMGAEEKRIAMEKDIFNDIRRAVSDLIAPIQETAGVLARIDCSSFPG